MARYVKNSTIEFFIAEVRRLLESGNINNIGEKFRTAIDNGAVFKSSELLSYKDKLDKLGRDDTVRIAMALSIAAAAIERASASRRHTSTLVKIYHNEFAAEVERSAAGMVLDDRFPDKRDELDEWLFTHQEATEDEYMSEHLRIFGS